MFPHASALLTVAVAAGGGGSTGSGPYSSTRWRVNMSAKPGSGAWFSLREIQWLDSVGGTDMANGGTASASASYVSSPVSNAFDNSDSTIWQSGTSAVPQWVEYAFASPVAPAALTLTNYASSDTPSAFTIEYYDGSTWQVAETVSADPMWMSSSDKVLFKIGTALTAAQAERWRIRETAKQNAGSYSAWAELEFKASAGGSDLTDTTKAFATSYDAVTSSTPSKAFDNNTGTKWSNGTTATGRSVGCVITTPSAITRVVATSSATANDSVTGFSVDYWDGNTWTSYWTVSTTNWTATETRTFDKP